MIRFDHLSAANISVLNEILASASLLRMDILRAAYSKHAQHFDSVLGLLEGLGCITVAHDEITITPSYRDSLLHLTANGDRQLKRFLVERLVYTDSRISKPIQLFLALFDGKRELSPSNSTRLRFGAVRNFLIDLEFLHLDVRTRKYSIAPEYLLEPGINRRKCSPKQLKALLAEKEKIGRVAEIAAIEFERQRLAHIPRLAKKIEHTAEEDAAAGYDILSFELEHGPDGIHRERFIEVKAVASGQASFYFTRNEMDTASRLRAQYFLYLVPVAGYLKVDIQGLKIIGDPATKVIDNPSHWRQTLEVIKFMERKDDRV